MDSGLNDGQLPAGNPPGGAQRRAHDSARGDSSPSAKLPRRADEQPHARMAGMVHLPQQRVPADDAGSRIGPVGLECVRRGLRSPVPADDRGADPATGSVATATTPPTTSWRGRGRGRRPNDSTASPGGLLTGTVRKPEPATAAAAAVLWPRWLLVGKPAGAGINAACLESHAATGIVESDDPERSDQLATDDDLETGPPDSGGPSGRPGSPEGVRFVLHGAAPDDRGEPDDRPSASVVRIQGCGQYSHRFAWRHPDAATRPPPELADDMHGIYDSSVGHNHLHWWHPHFRTWVLGAAARESQRWCQQHIEQDGGEHRRARQARADRIQRELSHKQRRGKGRGQRATDDRDTGSAAGQPSGRSPKRYSESRPGKAGQGARKGKKSNIIGFPPNPDTDSGTYYDRRHPIPAGAEPSESSGAEEERFCREVELEDARIAAERRAFAPQAQYRGEVASPQPGPSTAPDDWDVELARIDRRIAGFRAAAQKHATAAGCADWKDYSHALSGSDVDTDRDVEFDARDTLSPEQQREAEAAERNWQLLRDSERLGLYGAPPESPHRGPAPGESVADLWDALPADTDTATPCGGSAQASGSATDHRTSFAGCFTEREPLSPAVAS